MGFIGVINARNRFYFGKQVIKVLFNSRGGIPAFVRNLLVRIVII